MLTRENYHSVEMNKKYMGVSQLKSFVNCEAATIADINGEIEREVTTSLLESSYVDAHFSKELDLFKGKHPEIFTRSGDLKANYKKAERIIERIEQDDLFMEYMNGETQVIHTGEIEGVPFKVMADVLHQDKIVDLKIMRDMKPQFKDGLYLNFIEYWMYDVQGAVYQEIIAQNIGERLPFVIAVATKETEPEIALLEIPQQRLDFCLDWVKGNLDRASLIKSGLVEPVRCGKCNYCRSTNKLTKVVDYEEFFNTY